MFSPKYPRPATPAADGGEEGAAASMKAAKKAEAMDKKEDAAAALCQVVAESEGLAKDNYDSVKEKKPQLSTEATDAHLKSIKEKNVGMPLILRAWVQNSRMQGVVALLKLNG